MDKEKSPIFGGVGWLLLLTLVTGTLTGCDAGKIVRVTNRSAHPVELRTDFPTRSLFVMDSTGKYTEHFQAARDWAARANDRIVSVASVDNGLTIRLQPGQSFDLANHIGSGFIGIRPSDLNFSRLTILSGKDTIEAGNRQEILELTGNKKTCYDRKLDRKEVGISNRNFKYIIIRQ